jgi:2-(1,2-epoxy-1,2-dihydrophenyl)acetyl-CoA isomerase
MSDIVQSTLQDGVATLTLNRPQALNALEGGLMLALLAALREAAASEATRAIVITGAGRAFSAGADLQAIGMALAGGPAHAQAVVAQGMREQGNPLTQAIADCPLPVVAAVNGACVGGAVGVALAADVVLAARSAYFLVPQVAQLGLVPDLGATWSLPRLAGRSRALGLSLLGERIDALQAEQWGLIWRCVEDADLAEQAQAMALRLARLPVAALRDTRALINAAPTQALAPQLEAELEAQRRHAGSDFFKNACARFFGRSQKS